MHLPHRHQRPIPAAPPEDEYAPRAHALRWLTEKIAAREAGCDPFDPTIFIVKAGRDERVWAFRMLEQVGGVISIAPDPEGGQRLYALLEAGVRDELGLDWGIPRLMLDEPLASRAVDPVLPALRLLEPDEPKLTPGMRALRVARDAYDGRSVS